MLAEVLGRNVGLDTLPISHHARCASHVKYVSVPSSSISWSKKRSMHSATLLLTTYETTELVPAQVLLRAYDREQAGGALIEVAPGHRIFFGQNTGRSRALARYEIGLADERVARRFRAELPGAAVAQEAGAWQDTPAPRRCGSPARPWDAGPPTPTPPRAGRRLPKADNQAARRSLHEGVS